MMGPSPIIEKKYFVDRHLFSSYIIAHMFYFYYSDLLLLVSIYC